MGHDRPAREDSLPAGRDAIVPLASSRVVHDRVVLHSNVRAPRLNLLPSSDDLAAQAERINSLAVSNEHSCSALLVLQLQAFLAAAAHPRLLFPLWTEGYLNYTAKRMFDYCSQQGMTRFMDYTPKFRLVIINTNSLLHNHKYICAAALSQPQPQVLAPYPVGVGAVPGLIAP